jgi:hypothetical protein
MLPRAVASPRLESLIAGFAAVAAVVGFLLGISTIGRLPNHAGFFLVAFEDRIEAPLPSRPRHAVLIVVDGLRRDAALSMKVTRRLLEHGQCRVSHQGELTISRPVYTLLSSGVEVDRTGVRNNDLTTPAPVESVFEVAREDGRRVHGSSHLPWFRELFPAGFDQYRLGQSYAEDLFKDPDLVELNLFHPLYVDEAGHHYGGISSEYAQAVARADAEVSSLLDRLDFERDLVIFTADHGHTDSGGHGGAQPEVADVLACFAGLNVRHTAALGRMDGRVTAPLLAVLSGLRMPKHLRAVEDDLDVIEEIADFSHAPAYAEDRRKAVAAARARNQAWLAERGHHGPFAWTGFYAEQRRLQLVRGGGVALFGLLLFALSQRLRRASLKELLFTVLFVGLAALIVASVHRLVLGPFNYDVINLRSRFIPRALFIAGAAALMAVAAHALIARDKHRLLLDHATFLALSLLLAVGHCIVYGWQMGFPLPSAAELYAPFLLAFVVVSNALVSLGLVVSMKLGRRKAAIPTT